MSVAELSEERVNALVEAPVFLLGMPRSGTTWLSQIFEAAPQVLLRLSPNYSYALKNRIDEDSTAEDWREQLRNSIRLTDDPFMTHNWRREKGWLAWVDKDPAHAAQLVVKDTRFHDLYLRAMEKFPAAKAIFVVRHPCGHLNSWRTSPEFPSGGDFSRGWRDGAGRKSEGPGEYWGFDDWRRLAALFLGLETRDPRRYRVFRYEDLVARPLETTGRLFNFCGLDLTSEVEEFLQRSHASHNPNAYSVFRSPDVAEKWRTEFPPEIQLEIERELKGTALEQFL